MNHLTLNTFRNWTALPRLKMETWPFALLRFGVVLMIYVRLMSRFDQLPEYALMVKWGLPLLMSLAILGVHRYWFFALAFMIGEIFYADSFPFRLQFMSLVLTAITFFTGFTPCDRDFSLRAWWHGDKPYPEPESNSRSLFTFLRLMLSLLYFESFLRLSTSNFLSGLVIERRLVTRFFGSDFIYQWWFHPLCLWISGMVWGMYLLSAVAVWVPRIYRPFLIMAFAFHVLYIALAPGLNYLHWMFLLLLLPLIPVANWFPGLRESGRTPLATPQTV
jgi:hypothetical protein